MKRKDTTTIATQIKRLRKSKIAINYNGQEEIENNLGKKVFICDGCSAVHFVKEKKKVIGDKNYYSSCCSLNKLRLPDYNILPPVLLKLLSGNDEESKLFFNNIRYINKQLSFASIVPKIDASLDSGIPIYRVRGEVNRFISNINLNSTPRYGQLYFYDPNESRTLRNIENIQIDILVNKLDILLRDINIYAKSYKNMRDRNDLLGNSNNITMIFIYNKKKTFEAPISNEVSLIFDSNCDIPDIKHRFISVQMIGRQLQYLPLDSPNTDALIYPLIFPFGDLGYQKEFKIGRKNYKDISQLMFYLYRLSIRASDDRKTINQNLIYSFGPLTQQFIVDIYSRIEGSRLSYHRTVQNNLRKESVNTLRNVINGNNGSARNMGIPIILPSSFQGSMRNKQQLYQDSMAVVRFLGPPDLFITFTCNPKWDEIQNGLFKNERAEYRPDLVNTVFQLKLKQLIHEIVKDNIFGKVISLLYVIEFQKRGLPHSHILVTLSQNDKITTQNQIDTIICAELPDRVRNPKLFEIILSNLIHGPCSSSFNNKAPCMDGNVCKKHYPKEFVNSSFFNSNNFPIYRRRDTGISYNKGKYKINNQWVVPHNPYLCLTFNAHINVELCGSVDGIKYLHKYVYKGYDSAQIMISNDEAPDEIKEYLNMRYISPTEAMWRILSFPLSYSLINVVKLTIHLPNEQYVYFREGEEDEAIDNSHDTMLLAWFKLNIDSNDNESKQYLYTEIPTYYCWVNYSWKKRTYSSKAISRLYFVSPSQTEKFALRLLLQNIKGATSFDYLKTVNNVIFDNFYDAAVELNLLNSNKQTQFCMEEAIAYQMPAQLRELFVLLAIYNCTGNEAKEIFETNKKYLMDDYIIKGYSTEYALNKLLYTLNQLLLSNNSSLECIKLPLMSDRYNYDEEPTENIEMDKSYDDYYNKLNDKQREYFDTICDSIDGRLNKKHYFLEGIGGCGKTFLYNCLIKHENSRNHYVISVATTGIAANLLFNGTTVHSRFKLPMNLDSQFSSQIRYNSREAEYIRNASLIIWDEISMASKYLLEAVDSTLRFATDNKEIPFGGKVILLGGDFRQCLPVVKYGGEIEIVNTSVKKSELWSNFQVMKLFKNMRVDENNEEFKEWLLSVGNGKSNNIDNNIFTNTIFIDKKYFEEGSLIKFVFGDEIINTFDIKDNVILCPKNKDSLYLNLQVLELIQFEQTCFNSIDEIIETSVAINKHFPIEYVNSLTPSGMPPHKLILKVGAIVMLLRNINTYRGLCNGTRIIVINYQKEVLEGIILCGSHKGDHVLIPKLKLTSNETDAPVVFSRTQFPIRLAFCITINKSQGQTFNRIGIYLNDPIFSHGQLYVALSRAKDPNNIRIKVDNGIINEDGKFTVNNIVYKEVLK